MVESDDIGCTHGDVRDMPSCSHDAGVGTAVDDRGWVTGLQLGHRLDRC